MPRSGSTLLENILSLNQDVVDLGEIEILPEIMDQFDPLSNENNPYEKYIEHLNKLHPQVKIATDTSKGVKYVSEQYLVNATSVTHAEALVNKDFVDTGIDFEVKAVQDTRICKVIESQTPAL